MLTIYQSCYQFDCSIKNIMNEQLLLNHTQQQFCYGNTKYMFFFDKLQENTQAINRNIIKHQSTKSSQLTNHTKKIAEVKVEKQNKCMRICNLQKQNRKKYVKTSQAGNRVKNTFIRSYEHSPKSKTVRRDLSAKKIDKVGNKDGVKSRGKQNDQPNRAFLEVEEIKIPLSKQDIKIFLGVHHILYKQNLDYLAELKQQQIDQLYPQIIVSKVAQPQASGKIQYRLPSQFETNQSSLRNSYTFQNDRAGISKYIADKASKQLYNRIIKQNITGSRFIDKQFCHQSYSKIGEQQIKWVYLAPNPSLSIFPINSSIICSKPEIPFVKFIRFLYKAQPNLFFRLLEPPINNVFSVWLFVNGKFQPVFVDGYFPITNSNKMFFGQNNQFIWDSIFCKSICKMYRTFSIDILNSIGDNQVYKMLTGRNLNTLPMQYFQFETNKLLNFYKKQKNKNRILYFTKGSNYYVLNELNCMQILESNKNLQSSGLVSSIRIIQPLQNLSIYELLVYSKKVTKFEIFCQKNCQIIFGLPESKQKEYCKIYLYKYKNQQQPTKIECSIEETSNLTLYLQINLSQSSCLGSSSILKQHIKKGHYKLLFQQKQNLLKQLFQPYSSTSTPCSCSCLDAFSMTIMAGTQLKISKEELLVNKSGKIQDEGSYYLVNRNFPKFDWA